MLLNLTQLKSVESTDRDLLQNAFEFLHWSCKIQGTITKEGNQQMWWTEMRGLSAVVNIFKNRIWIVALREPWSVQHISQNLRTQVTCQA